MTKLHLCLFVQDEVAKQSAMLIYETALVESGFSLENPKDFAKRLYTVIKANLNLSPDAEAENEEEEADEEGEKEAAVEEGEMTDGFLESDEVSDLVVKLFRVSRFPFQFCNAWLVDIATYNAIWLLRLLTCITPEPKSECGYTQSWRCHYDSACILESEWCILTVEVEPQSSWRRGLPILGTWSVTVQGIGIIW